MAESDQQCLREVKDFLAFEQNVSPAMVDAFEDADDGDLVKQYADALSTQIAEAWKMLDGHLSKVASN